MGLVWVFSVNMPARPSEIRQDAEIQHRAMEIRPRRLLIGRGIFPRKLAKFCWRGRRRANTDRGSPAGVIFAHTSHHLPQLQQERWLASLPPPSSRAPPRSAPTSGEYGRQTPSGNFGFRDALEAAMRCFDGPDGVRARLRLVARRAMRRATRARTTRPAR
jgi:hypothetical protein